MLHGASMWTELLAIAQSGVCDSTGIKVWARTRGLYQTAASFQGRLVLKGGFY